jgi:hypothetical protein
MGSPLATAEKLEPFTKLTAGRAIKGSFDESLYSGNLESLTGHEVRALSPENRKHHVPVATVLLTVKRSTGSTFKDPRKAIGSPYCRVKPDGPSSTGPVKRGFERFGLSAA